MNRFMVCVGSLKQHALLALIAAFTMFNANGEDSAPGSSQLISAGMESSPAVLWHDDFASGWKAARKTGRPMVIFITSQRCHYCDAMKRETWCNGTVLEKMKEKFVAIRLTPDRNSKTLERIDVPAFPTTLIGHPDGHIISHRVGFQPPVEMQRFLETASQTVH